MKVSLLMLTYNAPWYVFKSIWTLRKTKGVDYELIVVDNHSKLLTRALVYIFYKCGYIDKLLLNKENSLFAKGNNIASKLVREDATHYLLINSDVKIVDPEWLEKLTRIHPDGGE